jgi:hypothetical protein
MSMASASAAPAPAPRSGGATSGSLRLRGSRQARLNAPRAFAESVPASDGDFAALSDILSPEETSTSKPRETVRTIAGKTFYLKDGRWVDASIDKESQNAQTPIVVEQFSDKYFELVGSLGREFSQYLAFEEASTFVFDGKIYQIEPAKNVQ